MRLLTPLSSWADRYCAFAFLILVTEQFAVTAQVASAADFREAEQFFKAGQYEECLAATEAGVQEVYRAEDWSLLRLQTQMVLGQYAAALETYQKGVERATESIRLRWAARDVMRFHGKPEEADVLFKEVGDRIRGQAWRYRVSGLDLVTVGQFQLESGLDPKSVLDGAYSSAKRTSSGRIAALIASGELALGKDDFGLAAEYFQEAVALDDANPDVWFGISQAFGPSDGEKAKEALEKALELNPSHTPSLLALASRLMDREAYDEAGDTLDRVLEVNSEEPRAWAYRAVLAHLKADEKGEEAAIKRALSHWMTNPEVPYLIGAKLSRNYRFAEAAEYQKMALRFDDDYLPAKLQLSQDLLRLGNESDGWSMATAVSEADPYNVLAYNLSTLRDHLDKYTVLKSGRFHVRMDHQEASLYGPRVLALLADAESVLSTKYKMTLPERVFVDIYPEQADFAIRTFGLPGGAGFLGVCFGPVITMNSPSAQGASPTSWESVLWHEFAHVVTLTKTENRMPRWLSEGISVFEERLKDARWGQSMTPAFRSMILSDDLTPVSQLSGAFLSPESGMHLQFAYYESSLVVEYLVAEFGHEALLAVLDDLAAGVSINDALSRHTADIDDLDQAFAEHIRELAKQYAEQADFAEVELPPDVDEETLNRLLEAHPNSVAILQRLVALHLAERKPENALEAINQAIQLFDGSLTPVDLLATKAEIEGRLGRTDARRRTLEQIVDVDSDQIDALRELMLHARSVDDTALAAEYAEQMLAVNPLLEAPYEVLASAAAARGDAAGGIEALTGLSVLGPSDPAGLHYRIAELCQSEERWSEAREHVLLALEEAPRYRDAHRLLLEIVKQSEQSDSNGNASNSGGEKSALPGSRSDRAVGR